MVNVKELKESVADVAQKLGFGSISPDWAGCDPVWALFEEMAKEGAVVVVKIDGQRTSEDDTGKYTVLVSGGPLGEDFFRADTHVLEEGLARAILHFAQKCWK